MAFLFGDDGMSFDTADKTEALTHLTERHFPDKLKPTESWSKLQACCHVCAKHGVRRDVTTFSSSCSSKPGLCSVRSMLSEMAYTDALLLLTNSSCTARYCNDKDTDCN